MPYHPALVQPMKDEITRVGVRDLASVEAVDELLGPASGSVLVFINSVCGCAAGNARPALMRALQHPTTPDVTASVFAGQDLDATARARSYIGADYQPSSPSFALLKDGEVVHFIHRHQIEGRGPEAIAADLTAAFDRFC